MVTIPGRLGKQRALAAPVRLGVHRIGFGVCAEMRSGGGVVDVPSGAAGPWVGCRVRPGLHAAEVGEGRLPEGCVQPGDGGGLVARKRLVGWGNGGFPSPTGCRPTGRPVGRVFWGAALLAVVSPGARRLFVSVMVGHLARGRCLDVEGGRSGAIGVGLDAAEGELDLALSDAEDGDELPRRIAREGRVRGWGGGVGGPLFPLLHADGRGGAV